jgi:hypothetical protein
MAQNLRQQIAENLETVLKDMQDPTPVRVTREPFNALELAITEFPAVLITAILETRQTITMGTPGVGRRMGTLEFEIRGFVRGNDLDRKRNDLIERIEETLDSERYRELISNGVTDSQVIRIDIIERMPPLAEFVVTYRVNYNYLRTTT